MEWIVLIVIAGFAYYCVVVKEAGMGGGGLAIEGYTPRYAGRGKCFLVVLTLTLVSSGCLGKVSPASAASSVAESYEDCILNAMRGVSSDVAARAIIAACRRKFPAEPVHQDDSMCRVITYPETSSRLRSAGRTRAIMEYP